jgi:hypothetical protein
MNHGDHPNCGLDYETDESTVTAFCPHCKHRFEDCLSGLPRGALVRMTSKHVKAIYGQGGRGAPINGRIVGSSYPWPIVQWSDGHTAPISIGNIERSKVKSS